MDYYFGDQLRWTYGFDNPNKAAALIASILPLLWLLVAGPFLIRKHVVKWLCLAAGSSLFCAGWWLLFKTYSRGGLAAAGAGACTRRWLPCSIAGGCRWALGPRYAGPAG
jgi:hypothetical protein